MLLAEALNAANIGVEATVYTNGWPEDDSRSRPRRFDSDLCRRRRRASIYSKLDRLKALQNRGIGMVCIPLRC